MVGKQYERGGIAKDGAKMVHAVATTVPSSPSSSAAHPAQRNTGMCGRSLLPAISGMWPKARISVMGGEQEPPACGRTVKRDQLAREGTGAFEGGRAEPSRSSPREVRNGGKPVLQHGAVMG